MNEFVADSIPVLGRALLHFVWQGGVIGLLAGIALFALRHARPQSRYLVLCLALLACLIAPVIDIAMQLAAASPAHAPSTQWAPGRPSASIVQASVFPLDAWARTGDAWLPTVVALWAAGACALCLRMALGVAWIGRLRATPQPKAQARWQERVDTLAARLGINRHVALRLVEGVNSPASAGWWRPVVLLPTALAARMPVELVEALLAHELAHVRRHDYLVNLLQGLVEALLFYHPVVWWLSRQARIEREHIADRLATGVLDSPRTLAVALAELSEFQSTSCTPPRLAQAAHGGHLMSRIEQLVRPGRRVAGARIAFPLLGIATACLAFYAHARIGTDAPSGSINAGTASAALPSPASVIAPASNPQPTLRVESVRGMPAARATAHTVADASVHGIIHIGDNGGGDRDGYALVRRDRPGITLSGAAKDAPAIGALRNRMDRDFLWVRRDGREYLITEPALLARAERAWQKSEALGREIQALSARMAPHQATMKALGAQMGQLAARGEPSSEMREAEKRIEQLAQQQGRLAAEQARRAAHMAARAERSDPRIGREMDALDARIEAEMQVLQVQIEREAERIEAEAERLARQSAPMEALGRRMEEAAKPMEAIGEQMEALGERQARLSEQADREMQAIIREAVERGLARPATPSRQ